MRVTDRMNEGLSTGDRPSLPDFPQGWKSEPNVMFEERDPEPDPFDWGPLKWGTPEEYDMVLAYFLGDLACGRDVTEAQTRGLVRRALTTSDVPQRIWTRLFAARVTGPNCPPAAGLPEGVRRDLEQIAIQLKEEPVADAATEVSPPDPE
jgi:hypothetical protein